MRRFALVLIGAFLLVMLVGCKKKGPEASGPTDQMLDIKGKVSKQYEGKKSEMGGMKGKAGGMGVPAGKMGGMGGPAGKMGGVSMPPGKTGPGPGTGAAPGTPEKTE